jgi:hypothetical protein
MDRTSLYRAASRMQRDGWLKIAAGTDARSRTAELTGKGRRILDSADPPWGRVQIAIIERFGRARWTVLVSELQRLSAIAQAVE